MAEGLKSLLVRRPRQLLQEPPSSEREESFKFLDRYSDHHWKRTLKANHQILRHEIRVKDVLPGCRSFLTDVEYLRVQGSDKADNTDRVDQLVEILLTKEKKDFEEFLVVLWQQGYAHSAVRLAEEAGVVLNISSGMATAVDRDASLTARAGIPSLANSVLSMPQSHVPGKAQGYRSGTPPMKEMEEWEGVVAFICHHFGGNAPRDVVSALHREVVPRRQSNSFPASIQQLSEAIQKVVKERRMTWFQFARYLLRSETTRPFVFKIVQYIRVGIRFVFKQKLSNNLGSDWYRLACAMGLPKTDVDSIEDRNDITLLGKIDAFLMTYQFPAFRSDEETTEFLVEALERACLPNIAAAVRRDLKNALQREASEMNKKNERQDLESYAEDAHQQDFKKSLEAALAKGSVEVEMVKCVTLGPPEAGKTQIKSALIGNFDHSSESTPMSTRAETVIQRYVHGKSTWEPLTRERLCKSLHTTVKKKMFTESASPSTTEAYSSTQVKEAQAPVVEPLRTGMHECTGVHDDGTGAFGDREDSKKALLRQFAAIRATVEEELKKGGTAEVKGLDKIRIIHMVDSGGQPAFFDIHPVIATSRAVYLLVYNMEEGLDHKPAITYRRKAFPTKQLQNIKQSNLDMIKDSLLILHDCKQKFTTLERELHHWFGDSISESADDMPVLVVGTRKRKESIAHESEKLAKECSYLPLWKKVLHSTDTGARLFAVESMDPDCQGVQSVRQEVNRAGCIFKFPLPISWFLCQLIFLSAEENLHVLTFSNLRDLCQQEHLISNPDEFLAMIRTFHLLGIFSFPYLDQKLAQHDHWRPDDKPVFTNPDVLYQQVTKILEMAYRDLAKTPMEPKARESLTALQSSGRLDSDTLGYLGIPDDLGFYSGFHAYLLERLVHWGLAANPTTKILEGEIVNSSAAFFIPSVLPVCAQEPVTCSESPLSFTFCLSLADGSKVHYVPRGIFPHLIVQIAGQSYEIQENTHHQSCLFRDVATFGIEPSHSNKMQYAYNVMVVDKMDRVTIAIDPAQEEKLSTADCRQIVRDFKEAMESVYEGIYQISLTVTEASECRCDKRLPSHLAMVIRCEDGCFAMQCLLPGKIKRYSCPPELAALLCDQAPAPHSAPVLTSTDPHEPMAKQQTTEPSHCQTPVPHPTPMMSELHPMAKQPPTGSPHHQPLPFSALQFLKAYEDEFAEVVHAKQSLLKLKHKGVISPDVKTSIDGANEEDAKYLLFEHFEKNATVDSLREYCKVAIAADGYPRMQKLGRKMMETLPPEAPTPYPPPVMTEPHPMAKQRPTEQPSDQQRPPPNGEGGMLSQRVTDRPDYLILFRIYVSRNAAGKGQAVLEGVGLDATAIKACFQSNPLDDEEAVQAGLIKWTDGSRQVFPCTWGVLISAMEYAGVGQQYITGLKTKLGLP